MKRQSLLLCLALVAPAAVHGSDLHNDLVRHANALERAAAEAGAGRLSGADSARIDAFDEALRARIDTHRTQIDATLLRKAHRLEGLRGLLQHARVGGIPAAGTVPALQRAIHLGEGVGATCATALPLGSGEALRHAIGSGATVWYRVDGPGNAALRVSTRGSTVDPTLAAFADCRVADGEPIAEDDDSFGLQADLSLVPNKQTFWYVRAKNLGQQGELVISAVQAIAISGRVTRAAGGAGIPGLRVSAFRIEGGFVNFAGDAPTDPSGNYALAVVGSGTYALRTADSGGPSGGLIHQAYDGFRCRSGYYFDLNSCGTGNINYTPIILSDPGSRTVDFALSQAGSLVGTISSSAGGPVVGATVSLHTASGYELGYATSDALGRWRIEGVSPDGVYITAGSIDHARTLHSGVECPGPSVFNCPFSSGTLVTVPTESQVRVDMSLRRQQFVDVAFTINGVPLPDDPYGSTVSPSLLNSNGVAVTSGAVVSGGRYRLGPVAPGSYRLRATSNLAYPQLYPDVACATDCVGELGQGTPIVVTAADAAVEVSMNLRRYPRIEGRVTSESDAAPIAGAVVSLVPAASGYYFFQSISSGSGEYRFDAVPPGNYLLRFASNQHVDEVHDNVPCNSDNPGLNCPGATLIAVGSNTPDRTINAALVRSASLTGRITASGALYGLGYLSLLTPAGTTVANWSTFLTQDGRYTVNDVPDGTWFVAGSAVGQYSLIPQIFNGVDCPAANSGSFASCALAQATPVVTTPGNTSGGIDFALRRVGGQAVRVLNAFDDTPISQVMIDVWNGQGQRVDSRPTNAAGLAFPAAGTSGTAFAHALSTDNTQGLINEVYQDIECTNGSVFFGTCALTGYTPVMFPAPANAPEILIRIARPVPIFGGTFEQ